VTGWAGRDALPTFLTRRAGPHRMRSRFVQRFGPTAPSSKNRREKEGATTTLARETIMRTLRCCALVLVGIGCSVPPTMLGHDAKMLREALDDLETASIKGDRTDTSRAMDKVKELAEMLASSTYVGDPRREVAEKALARVRELRAERDAKADLEVMSELDRAAQMAQGALERAAAANVTVAGPPTDLDLSALQGEDEARAADIDESEDVADKDLDRPGRRRGVGEKEGDVEDVADEKKPKDKDAPKAEYTVDETTEAVTVLPPVMKKKGIAVYFYFYSKSSSVRIAAVHAVFKGSRRGDSTNSLTTFKADTFEPKWDDILDSKGESLTGDSVGVLQGQFVKLVAVGEAFKGGKVIEASVEVTSNDGHTHAGIWKAEE
jgi:hypothetical protein